MRNPKFLGVYSQKKPVRGSGAKPSLYFVWELSSGLFAVQLLDKAFAPQGPIMPVSAARLEGEFQLQPGILAAPLVTPDFRPLQASLRAAAERDREDDAAMRALEKARKAKQVENDMRDNFARAMRALNRPRDRKGALVALDQIIRVKKGIVPEHRHMFRDFGVSLRKKAQYELALASAMRALELSPGDDHAHFNIARILDSMGRYSQANEHLRKALQLDASEKVYGRMQAYLRSKRPVDSDDED